MTMSEDDRWAGRVREPLEGVVLVSVGDRRAEEAVPGAEHAHVARINDLPLLIHAYASEEQA
jgi:hypothetical protein